MKLHAIKCNYTFLLSKLEVMDLIRSRCWTKCCIYPWQKSNGEKPPGQFLLGIIHKWCYPHYSRQGGRMGVKKLGFLPLWRTHQTGRVEFFSETDKRGGPNDSVDEGKKQNLINKHSSALWLTLLEEGYNNSKNMFFVLFWACMEWFWVK